MEVLERRSDEEVVFYREEFTARLKRACTFFPLVDRNDDDHEDGCHDGQDDEDDPHEGTAEPATVRRGASRVELLNLP